MKTTFKYDMLKRMVNQEWNATPPEHFKLGHFHLEILLQVSQPVVGGLEETAQNWLSCTQTTCHNKPISDGHRLANISQRQRYFGCFLSLGFLLQLLETTGRTFYFIKYSITYVSHSYLRVVCGNDGIFALTGSPSNSILNSSLRSSGHCFQCVNASPGY